MTVRGGPARLLLLGRVATLAGASGPAWVDGIAIRHGRVLATGAEADLRHLRGPGTQTWRLGAGRVALPGIVDAHLHLASAAIAARQPDLSGVSDRAATLAAIGRAHTGLDASGDRSGWLLGHGWSLDRLGGWPTAAELEAHAPGRRAALWSHDHHARWISPAALSATGIDRSTGDPPGGRIGRSADGEPDGMLFEAAATMVDRVIPPPDATRLAADMTVYAAELARLGVVGAHDPGEVLADPGLRRGPSLYRSLAAAGRLPLRVVASVREEQLSVALATGFRTGRGLAARTRDAGAGHFPRGGAAGRI